MNPQPLQPSERQCRDRARALFALAVCEDDRDAREALLRRGEGWMLQSRLGSPSRPAAPGL